MNLTASPLQCQSCPPTPLTIATFVPHVQFLLLRKLRSRVRCLLHHLGGRLHQQQLPEEPHVHRQPELPKHLLIVFSHMQIHSFKGSCSSKVVKAKSLPKGTSDICMIRLDFVDGTIPEPAGIRSPVFVLSIFHCI